MTGLVLIMGCWLNVKNCDSFKGGQDISYVNRRNIVSDILGGATLLSDGKRVPKSMLVQVGTVVICVFPFEKCAEGGREAVVEFIS